MPTFDVERQELTAFAIGDSYFFTEYFDRDDLFTALKDYYNADSYRFEIPHGNLDTIRQILDRFFNDLVIADKLAPYCVVLQRDTDATPFLRSTVMQQASRRYRIFLMKDRLSVEQAVEHGAQPLAESHINEEDLTWEIDRS